MQRLQKLFFLITIASLLLLLVLWYKDYNFNNNPLEEHLQKRVFQKEYQLKLKTKHYYKIRKNFPLIITNKLQANKYGMTTLNKQGQIHIYLNKKRFKENSDYMINDVLPHEYAHAIMFALGDYSNKNSGHTLKWQKICKNLGGTKCDRFVNRNDILIEKTNPFK